LHIDYIKELESIKEYTGREEVISKPYADVSRNNPQVITSIVYFLARYIFLATGVQKTE